MSFYSESILTYNISNFRSEKTECSNGPHLHFEVRNSLGIPIDLNGMVISGFVIKTGTSSYDDGCHDTDGWNPCNATMTPEQINKTCSTVFRRESDGSIFCPTVQGANWGNQETKLLILAY